MSQKQLYSVTRVALAFTVFFSHDTDEFRTAEAAESYLESKRVATVYSTTPLFKLKHKSASDGILIQGISLQTCKHYILPNYSSYLMQKRSFDNVAGSVFFLCLKFENERSLLQSMTSALYKYTKRCYMLT